MTKAISKLEDHLGYWLRCLSNRVHIGFADKLARHDISVEQWVVLRRLYDLKDATLTEAASAVGVDKSALSRMVERLAKRGLVSRKEGLNRRSIGLTLTESGRNLVPQLAKLADENDREFFRDFSMKQKIDLRAALKEALVSNGWEQSKHGKDAME